MGDIAIVIVNYNTRDHLRACLATIPRGAGEVVVVDNASTDGSADMVRSEHPGCVLIANENNPGYGAAANQGVCACRSRYILVLNSDTLLAPGALNGLRDYLDHHPRVGIAGPRLLNPDGTLQVSCFPFPGTLGWLLENDPVARIMGWIPTVRRRLYCFSPPKRAVAVPWLRGAALAIRREAFKEMNGFDESFFMYFEEVDLCARLWAASWEIHFVPDCEVTHHWHASTSQVRASMTIAYYRSAFKFYRRYYRGLRLATWLLIMRTKLVYQWLRHNLILLLASKPEHRSRLRADIAAWLQTLNCLDR